MEVQLSIFDILKKEAEEYITFSKAHYKCKFCGYDPRGGVEPCYKKVRFYLLVDDNWQVLHTYCQNCVNGDFGADHEKRRHDNLSLIEGNKFTEKTLKNLGKTKNLNNENGVRQYRPFGRIASRKEDKMKIDYEDVINEMWHNSHTKCYESYCLDAGGGVVNDITEEEKEEIIKEIKNDKNI